MDKKNLRAQYEKAYVYMAMGEWREVLYYSYEVLDEESDYYIDACLLYGSALDKSGRSKQALKFYKKVLKDHPNESLIAYNLALSYFNIKDWDNAQESVQKSIVIDKMNLESHLLLSSILLKKGERFKALLPLYYYLLFDQDSGKSIDAHNQLLNIWNLLAMNNGKNVTMPLSSFSDSGMIELEIGAKAIASEFITNDYKRKMEQPERLAAQTQELLDLLSTAEVESLDFIDITYVDFFKTLTSSGYADVYSYYISTCIYKEKILVWITEHNKSFLSFMDWMELQQ